MKAIRVRKLYDGTLNAPLENAVIVIEDGKIRDVFSGNSSSNGPVFSDMEDYSQYYMMPGMVDCHVHLMLPGDGMWGEDEVAAWTDGEIAVQAYRNSLTALSAGVTALRDCGAAYNVAIKVRNAFERQGVNGPDIVACGAPLTCTGGHCGYMGGEVDGPEDIRKKIREQQKAGADFVKVMATYGGTRGVTKTFTFSDEELQAAIDEAHLRGMKIAVHTCIVEMTQKLAEMDVDTIEHTVLNTADCSRNIYDEELVEKIRNQHIYVDHTICCVAGFLKKWEGIVLSGKATPAEQKLYLSNKEYDKLTKESFRFQVERRVPFVVGTDSGWRFADFKNSYCENLVVMREYGASDRELICAATSRAAEAIGLQSRLGTIEKGKQADLLILEKDPGVNFPEAVRHPTVVIKRGKLCNRAKESYRNSIDKNMKDETH